MRRKSVKEGDSLRSTMPGGSSELAEVQEKLELLNIEYDRLNDEWTGRLAAQENEFQREKHVRCSGGPQQHASCHYLGLDSSLSFLPLTKICREFKPWPIHGRKSRTAFHSEL